ncbi:MAG: hypothetical protein MUD12_10095 [Spirochaetes bacterium]|jgi:hypothetical protein|nr:hypothetical protein [Spirochaetota bacterium]
MHKRTCILDSSSAIILQKAGILHLLPGIYFLKASESVYGELTGSDHAGTDDFMRFAESGLMDVLKAPEFMDGNGNPDQRLFRLDPGERDSIILYFSGAGEFIILDDGDGAAFCRERHIPHINSILVPKVLFFSGKITIEECQNKMSEIISIGRYSYRVIDFAVKCERSHLEKFIV